MKIMIIGILAVGVMLGQSAPPGSDPTHDPHGYWTARLAMQAYIASHTAITNQTLTTVQQTWQTANSLWQGANANQAQIREQEKERKAKAEQAK